MQRTIPTLKGGRLYQSETDSDPIVIGTPAWYDWLEHHTAFTFADHVGTFHARKQVKGAGDLKWKAYRTREGKLYRVHLGHSDSLILDRLLVAARILAGEAAQVESVKVSQAESAISLHPVPKTADNPGSPSSLMRTKLYPPRNRSDLISRARLIERLNEGLSGNVTLLCAPAGFGKTTLLTQWLQTIERQTAWLSLDANDNELRTFVQSLTAALQTIFLMRSRPLQVCSWRRGSHLLLKLLPCSSMIWLICLKMLCWSWIIISSSVRVRYTPCSTS